MKGYLYQPIEEREKIIERKCFRVDQRNLYKIPSLEPIYLLKNDVPEIKSKGKLIEPVFLHPAGYFQLTDQYPEVTFTGIVLKTRLIYEITKCETLKETVAIFNDIPIYEMKIEIYEAKLVNEIIDSSRPFLVKIEGKALTLYAECLLERNILSIFGQPIIHQTIS